MRSWDAKLKLQCTGREIFDLVLERGWYSSRHMDPGTHGDMTLGNVSSVGDTALAVGAVMDMLKMPGSLRSTIYCLKTKT